MTPMPPKTKAKAKGRVKAVRMLATGPCGNCPTMYLNPHERHTDPGSRPVLVLDATPEAEEARVEEGAKAIWMHGNPGCSWFTFGKPWHAEYRGKSRAILSALGLAKR